MIKSLELLASDVNSTWMMASTDAVEDMSNNEHASDLDAVRVTTYARDATSPTMTAFELFDADSGEMVLTFSEAVKIDTLVMTRVTLQSLSSGGSTCTLTSGTSSYVASSLKRGIAITLSDDDERAIKLIGDLATNVSSVFVSLANGVVDDMAGNAAGGVPPENATQASSFVADVTRPSLQSFALDMNAGLLTCTFDDVVDVGTLNVAEITVQGAADTAAH